MNPSSTTTLDLFGGEIKAQPRGSCLTDKIAKIIETRTSNTRLRNEQIIKAFNQKYNEERKRYDDVIAELCQEFALAKRTIETVLKS